MKTTTQILMLMAVLSLMSCRQLHVVTLYVDTEKISQDSTAKYASFGQPEGISNEEFTIYVRKRDRVIWNAVSTSDPTDVVNVTSIINIPGKDYQNEPYVNFFKEGDTIVFNTKILTSPYIAMRSSRNRTIQSSTKNVKGIFRRVIKKGKPGDKQKYSLGFTINGNGNEIKIDPKMEMFY